MKTCKDCELPFTYDNFHKKSGMPDGYALYCKVCISIRNKENYHNNKSVREAALRRSKESKLTAKKFVIDYLSTHPCVECGESRLPCLDFDHQRDKTMNISFMTAHGYGVESIKLEIEKCQVLCANCHRVKTADQFGWYSWYPR